MVVMDAYHIAGCYRATLDLSHELLTIIYGSNGIIYGSYDVEIQPTKVQSLYTYLRYGGSGLLHPLSALKAKRLGHHTHSECSGLLGTLCYHRGSS